MHTPATQPMGVEQQLRSFSSIAQGGALHSLMVVHAPALEEEDEDDEEDVDATQAEAAQLRVKGGSLSTRPPQACVSHSWVQAPVLASVLQSMQNVHVPLGFPGEGLAYDPPWSSQNRR